MSVDITHYISYSTPIPYANARDQDRLALALALLTSSDVLTRRGEDFPYGLGAINDFNEVFGIEFAFDQTSSGTPYFPFLPGGYVKMEKYDTKHKSLTSIQEFFTDERKKLIEDLADIFDAPEPEWMAFSMVS